MTEQITTQQLIKRFAQVQQISIEEAQQTIGAETPQEILQNIKKFTQNKIKSTMHMNRAQRRAAAKKKGKKKKNAVNAITETATKINYIDLIQKLRALNKKREEEENENSKKSDLSV